MSGAAATKGQKHVLPNYVYRQLTARTSSPFREEVRLDRTFFLLE
jgi:hypothetical protein